MSRLLIVSHTPHFRRGDTFVGWGATVRELDQLARLFDEVVHVAPVYPTIPDGTALPYQNARVTLRPVAPAGGNSIRAKLGILAHCPSYIRTIHREARRADVIHVRCPAAMSLLAVLLLAIMPRPQLRWIKYAGNWEGYPEEPSSYRLQRWMLQRNVPRARVTVNGNWPDQPKHVVSFLNPCLTAIELKQGQEAAAGKTLTTPIRLLYVGRVEEAKGAGRALQIVAELSRRGIESLLDVIGDGPASPYCHDLARKLHISDQVTFRGWCQRSDLNDHYAAAHFLLLPTVASEGWPKVASEGMSFGVVPLLGSVSTIPKYLQTFHCGRSIPAGNRDQFVREIEAYLDQPSRWQTESAAAIEAARDFTYERYLEAVVRLIAGSDTSLGDEVVFADGEECLRFH